MKEAVSVTTIFQIVILFILLFTAIMCLTINNSNAFGVKDEILNIIEMNNGNYLDSDGDLNEDIVNAIAQEAYRTTGICEEGYKGYERNGAYVNEGDRASVCIKEVNVTEGISTYLNNVLGDTVAPNFIEGKYYQIILFYQLDLPVMRQVYNFRTKGETKVIYQETRTVTTSTYIPDNSELESDNILSDISNPNNQESPNNQGSTDNTSNPNGSSQTNPQTPITSDAKILILAGHSFQPYCGKVSNECRGVWQSSGYDETVETRKLARALRTQLNSLGLQADIANELLTPGDSNMSTSFYVERRLNTAIFRQYNWSTYDYAIELHFNASAAHNAHGTVAIVNNGYSGIPIDYEIVTSVTRFTGNSNRGVQVTNTGNYGYFKGLGIPFTYLEVEFYDNKTAMEKYSANLNNIASAMAQVIYKYYGQ